MPSVNIENGKRIEELMEISTFSTSAHFLVSENNLTRKTSLLNLRNMFNGDEAITDLNNVYYSVEKINEIIDHLNDEFEKLGIRLDNLNMKIQDIYTNLGADLDEFKKRMELIYSELLQADSDLLEYIKEQLAKEIEARKEGDENLQELLNQEIQARTDADTLLQTNIDKLSTTVTNNYNALNTKIDQEISDRKTQDSQLSTKISNNTLLIQTLQSNFNVLKARVDALEGRFSYGTAAPTTLTNGHFYFQYF